MTIETASPLTLRRPRPRQASARTAVIRQAPARQQAAETTSVIAQTARSLAVAGVEVVCGLRAPATIARWVEPELYESMCRTAALRESLRGAAPRVRLVSTGRARLCRIGTTIVEAAIVVGSVTRNRAVALRLEFRSDRWIMTQFVAM